jgi:hypothetical protein
MIAAMRDMCIVLTCLHAERRGVEPPATILAARDRLRRSLSPGDWDALSAAIAAALDILEEGASESSP